MKTKLVDFDIEKARNGAKVVAEYDKHFVRPCRIVCYDAKEQNPIVALIYYECDKGERIHTFNIQGSDDIFNLKIEESEFENGDIIAYRNDTLKLEIGILKKIYILLGIPVYKIYVGLRNGLTIDEYDCLPCYVRLATVEEKLKLFNALEEDGKCWNSEKKCLEEIARKDRDFKAFDRVLVRDNNFDKWETDIFQEYGEYVYKCFRYMWKQCIPYEGNESLLGTTNKPIN